MHVNSSRMAAQFRSPIRASQSGCGTVTVTQPEADNGGNQTEPPTTTPGSNGGGGLPAPVEAILSALDTPSNEAWAGGLALFLIAVALAASTA